MFEEYMNQIISEAEAAYPKEAVWLITSKGCRLAENISENAEEHFRVSEQDSFLAHKEGLLAVVHSHCDLPVAPSKLDMEGQVITGVSWGIVQVADGQYVRHVWWGDEVPNPPLLGRRFIHGISDCWNLARDFYSAHDLQFDIVPRDWQWWMYEDMSILWKDFGFVEVPITQAEYGDMVLIRVRGEHTHHCGVMVGAEEFIHHPGADVMYDESRLSVKDSIHRYRPYVVKVVRHPDMAGKERITL